MILQALPGPGGSATPLVPRSPEGLLRFRSQPDEAGIAGELRRGQDAYGSRLQQMGRLDEFRESPTFGVEDCGEPILQPPRPKGRGTGNRLLPTPGKRFAGTERFR